MSAPTTIRELLVRLGVKADDAALARFDVGIERAKTGMQQASKAAAVMVGAFAAIAGGLALNTRAVAAEIESVKLLSDALGITTEQYQKLTYAGSTVGANAELVRVSLGKLSTVIQGAKEGEQGATDALAAFGLTLADIQGMNPAEVFARVADSTKGMEDPFKRSRAAARLFGEEAVTKLVPLLQQGSAGLAMLGDQATAAGAILGGDAVDGALAYQDAQNQLMATVGALKTAIGVAFLPTMTRAIERVRVFLARPSTREGLESTVRLVGKAVDALLMGFAGADKIVTGVLGGWDKLLIGIAASLAVITGAKGLMGLYTMAAGIGAAVTALGSLLGLAGAPLWITFGLILAAIAATLAGFAVLAAPAVLALQDLYVFATGGESAFGKLLDRMPTIRDSFRSLGESAARAGTALGGVLSAVWSLIGAAGRILAVTPGVRIFGEALQIVADTLTEWTTGEMEDTEKLVGEAARGAEKLAGWLESAAKATENAAAGFSRIVDDALPAIAAFFARWTPSIETLGKVGGAFTGPATALAGAAASQFGAANTAAAVAPSASFGGRAAMAAAQGAGGLARAGVSRITTSTASIAPIFNITSTDPAGAAREVEAALERAARSAQATLLGGER